MAPGQPIGFVQLWMVDLETAAKDPDVAQALRESTNGQALNEAALLKRLLAIAELRAEKVDGH